MSLRLCVMTKITSKIISFNSNCLLSTIYDPPLPSYDPYKPIDMFQTMVCTMHEVTGLSWTASLCLTAFGLRVTLLPLLLHCHRSQRRNARWSPELLEIQDKYAKLKEDVDVAVCNIKCLQSRVFFEKN